MSLFLNVLWIIFGGLEVAMAYFVGGIVLCLTIVGIPFGFQAFKIGIYALIPFGASHVYDHRQTGCLSTIMNIVWVLLFGIIISMIHLLFGLVLCITIIGIPFGIQHFKLMALAIAPFGADIIRH